jgi:hypothetical protein
MSGTNDVLRIIGDIPFVDFDNSSIVRFWGGGEQCEKGGRKKGNVICSMQGERNPVQLSLLPDIS